MTRNTRKLCNVCGEPSCVVSKWNWPGPAPFTVQLLRELDGSESLWFNVPQLLNWNWYCVERAGFWCWEDLLHQVARGAALTAVPFDDERYYWGCVGVTDWNEGTLCDRGWTSEELSTLIPGYPGSVPTCPVCRDASWPTPRRRRGAGDAT